MIISFCFSIEDFIKTVCLNTKCIMSLIDQSFLNKNLSDLAVQWTQSQIMMQRINNWTHQYQKYVWLSFYLLDVLFNEKIIIVYITRDVHLVNNFWANLLLNMNIIKSKHISTDILFCKIIIEKCCNLLVNLNIMSQKDHICWIIQFIIKTVISS